MDKDLLKLKDLVEKMQIKHTAVNFYSLFKALIEDVDVKLNFLVIMLIIEYATIIKPERISCLLPSDGDDFKLAHVPSYINTYATIKPKSLFNSMPSASLSTISCEHLFTFHLGVDKIPFETSLTFDSQNHLLLIMNYDYPPIVSVSDLTTGHIHVYPKEIAFMRAVGKFIKMTKVDKITGNVTSLFGYLKDLKTFIDYDTQDISFKCFNDLFKPDLSSEFITFDEEDMNCFAICPIVKGCYSRIMRRPTFSEWIPPLYHDIKMLSAHKLYLIQPSCAPVYFGDCNIESRFINHCLWHYKLSDECWLGYSSFSLYFAQAGKVISRIPIDIPIENSFFYGIVALPNQVRDDMWEGILVRKHGSDKIERLKATNRQLVILLMYRHDSTFYIDQVTIAPE